MGDWKTVRVRQELLDAVERAVEAGRYGSLAEFVSEAVQLRLKELHEGRGEAVAKAVECPVLEERMLFSCEHMWAVVTPEGNVRVGLSDFAQKRLEGVSGVHVDAVGCEVRRGEAFGVVETWMFRFDLVAPVSGRVVRVNEALGERPVLVNEDSYGAGWVVEVRPGDSVVLEEELRGLMGSREYRLFVLRQRRLGREKL